MPVLKATQQICLEQRNTIVDGVTRKRQVDRYDVPDLTTTRHHDDTVRELDGFTNVMGDKN